MSSMNKRDYAAKQKGKQEYKEDHGFRASNGKRDRRRSKDKANRDATFTDES